MPALTGAVGIPIDLGPGTTSHSAAGAWAEVVADGRVARSRSLSIDPYTSVGSSPIQLNPKSVTYSRS